jgi:hypothetical protein
VDASHDGRTRVQSHRNTQRTDYFCRHRGNVVRPIGLATSKQEGRRIPMPSTKHSSVRYDSGVLYDCDVYRRRQRRTNEALPCREQ